MARQQEVLVLLLAQLYDDDPESFRLVGPDGESFAFDRWYFQHWAEEHGIDVTAPSSVDDIGLR